MIGIFNAIKDNAGVSWLSNYQITGDYSLSARIIRSKTLEGGTIFTHLGTTETDRDLIIEGNATVDQIALLKNYSNNADEIMVAYWDGFYRCLISHVDIKRNGEIKIKFYLKEKIA